MPWPVEDRAVSPAGARGPRRADLAGLRRRRAGLGGPRRGGRRRRAWTPRPPTGCGTGCGPSPTTATWPRSGRTSPAARPSSRTGTTATRRTCASRRRGARRAAAPARGTSGSPCSSTSTCTRPRSGRSTGWSAGWSSATCDRLEQTAVARWQDELPRLLAGSMLLVDAAGTAPVVALPVGEARAAAFAGTAGADLRRGGRPSTPRAPRGAAAGAGASRRTPSPITTTPRCRAHGRPGRRGRGAAGAGRRRGRARAGRRRRPDAPQVDVVRSEAAQRLRAPHVRGGVTRRWRCRASRVCGTERGLVSRPHVDASASTS